MASNVTNDWTVQESVKANLRRLVKRLLRKYLRVHYYSELVAF
ncbi:type I restriction enzyme endonuclease domain-containing protein [Nostoc sp. CALU 1950]